MNKSVVVKNLTFKYHKGVNVFSGVNFELTDGENLAVLGGIDSGKSTLADILAGLEQGWLGSVEVLGECPKDFSLGEARKHIFYLPREQVFLESKTIRENLDFSRSVLGMEKISDEELSRILEKLGAPSDTKVKKLSKIQKLVLEEERMKLKSVKVMIVDRRADFWSEEELVLARPICERMLRASGARSVIVFCDTKADFDFWNCKDFGVLFLNLGTAQKFDKLEDLTLSPPNKNAMNFVGQTHEKRLAVLSHENHEWRVGLSRFETKEEFDLFFANMNKKRKKTHKTHEKQHQNVQNAENIAKSEELFRDEFKLKPHGKIAQKLNEWGAQNGDMIELFCPDSSHAFESNEKFDFEAESGQVFGFCAVTGERIF